MCALAPNKSPGQTKLRFMRPTVPPVDKVLEYYLPSFEDGALTNGKLVAVLEAAVAERLRVSYCVAVSSCTLGLSLVLKALGVTGEVVLPSYTFFATGHAVLWNNLEPVFADCDPESWTIDPADVKAKITDRTSAILAVHLYGNPARVDELQQIAYNRGLKLIFDAAHAFGSEYRGVPVGGFGDAEVFSLSPTKLLVGGEGGLVCTNDATLARLLKAARNYGDAGSYDPEMLGLNARMTEFNAALALAGLELVENKVRRHNEIAEHYTRLLGHVPGIRFQKLESDDRSAYKDYSVLISPSNFGMSRDQVAPALADEGIPTRKYFYPPLHHQRLFKAPHTNDGLVLPNTEKISEEVLSLPIYESLPDSAVEKIGLTISRLARDTARMFV